MFKIGIVGSGFMAVTHAEAYKQIPDARIVGFVGKGEANRRRRAQEYDTRDFPTIAALLEEADPDVVDICTPTHLNVEMTRAAAQAGKAILLEKPIALDLDAAAEIQRLAADAGVTLMVAHVIRFWPEYARIAEIVRAGDIGRPYAAAADRICQPPDWTTWYADPNKSGGVAVTLMIHDFDFCNSLFGPPQRVFASGRRNALGAFDHLHACVVYPSGVTASFRGSISMPAGYPFTMSLRVTGDAGAAEFVFRAGINLENRQEAQSDFILYRGGQPSIPSCDPRDAYLAEIEYFLNCLRDGRAPEIGTIEEATLALRTARAAMEAAETGAVVEMG